MRISGTEPSSVILNNVISKVGKWCPKSAETVEAKGDGVINPQNYNLSPF